MTKAIAIRNHRSNYPNPIVFKKGDPLVLGELDAEYEGWRRVITLSGNEGWAPVAYIEALDGGPSGLAIKDYCAVELHINAGEYLEVRSEHAGWCWVESGRGEAGWVPKESISFR